MIHCLNAKRLSLIAVFILTSCSSIPKSGNNKEPEHGPGSVHGSVEGVIEKDGSSSSNHAVQVTSLPPMTVRGVKLQNLQFDFPVVVNSRVEYWIDYFTGRGRSNFERYLERSELFIPYITPILRENGMPEDLVYLAMIESGFNNHARSQAKAVGPWQFISATGKRYGLMVNWWVDERRDTQKSTLAAVGYLKDLYGMFGSWELASAAYNAGEAKVARAIQRFGSKDFWTLSRQRFLRQETRDYVPKIIAAAILAKNRTQFGFAQTYFKPLVGEVVTGEGEIVKVLNTSKDDASKLATSSREEDQETLAEILKTDGSANAAPVPLEGATLPGHESASKAHFVTIPLVNKKGGLSGESVAEFEVDSPADFQKIADAAGLSYATIKSLNPEVLRWCTPPSVGSYHIKLPVSIKDKFLETYNSEGFQRRVQFLAYKARPGDTISRIARHFGLKPDPVTDLNGYSSKAVLRAGTKVLLPLPLDRTRSLASLEVRDAPERRSHRRRRRSTTMYKVNVQSRQSAQGTRISLMDR